MCDQRDVEIKTLHPDGSQSCSARSEKASGKGGAIVRRFASGRSRQLPGQQNPVAHCSQKSLRSRREASPDAPDRSARETFVATYDSVADIPRLATDLACTWPGGALMPPARRH